jgi:putative hydrolase of the HAD superfamily
MRSQIKPNRRALLVDAMGTVVALRPPAPALRRGLSERFGISISLEQADRALRAEIAYYRAHLDDGRDADSVKALRRRCAEVLRGALPGGEQLRQVPGEALTETLLASLRFRAYDDAAPALVAARERGERVIVVSNWDVSLVEVLERIGLMSRIDGVVTSAGVGAGKPSPAIFKAALALAETSAPHALHVGDSVVEDFDGARAAGIEAVLIRRDPNPGPAGVPTITSLAELGATC